MVVCDSSDESSELICDSSEESSVVVDTSDEASEKSSDVNSEEGSDSSEVISVVLSIEEKISVLEMCAPDGDNTDLNNSVKEIKTNYFILTQAITLMKEKYDNIQLNANSASNEKVNEFFKIPVPDDCEVTISADSGGETSAIWSDYQKDFYGMHYTQDTVFLISFDDNRIYSINYGENEVYEDTLKIAYEPEEIFEINEVDITDKTLVLLGIDKRHRQTLLRVLDLKTMECIQKAP